MDEMDKKIRRLQAAAAIQAKRAGVDEESRISAGSTQCDQCEALTINGIYCHEHGCPNEQKVTND